MNITALRTPIAGKADQWSIYKHDRGGELKATGNNSSLYSERDLNPRSSDFKSGTLTTRPHRAFRKLRQSASCSVVIACDRPISNDMAYGRKHAFPSRCPCNCPFYVLSETVHVLIVLERHEKIRILSKMKFSYTTSFLLCFRSRMLSDNPIKTIKSEAFRVPRRVDLKM